MLSGTSTRTPAQVGRRTSSEQLIKGSPSEMGSLCGKGTVCLGVHWRSIRSHSSEETRSWYTCLDCVRRRIFPRLRENTFDRDSTKVAHEIDVRKAEQLAASTGSMDEQQAAATEPAEA